MKKTMGCCRAVLCLALVIQLGGALVLPGYAGTPVLTLSPESFAVTNVLGGETVCVLNLGNAPGADADLNIELSTHDTGRELIEVATAPVEQVASGFSLDAARPGGSSKPGRLLVRFSPELQSKRGKDMRALTLADALPGMLTVAESATMIEQEYGLVSGLCRVELPEHVSAEQALSALNGAPGVLYAEPDYEVHINRVPDDASFSELWGLHNTGQTGGTPGADIGASDAWDIQTGSHEVIVAVIDTGVDYNHEDLAANMWINTGEIPGNGIDDDSNGYIDDVYGINAITGSGNPMDDHNHGTHCAGTIGAVGNNGVGVVGVSWQVRILALKFLNADGSGYISDAITCIEYAIAKKAKVLSNSWGGGGYSQAMNDVIDAAGAAGISFVAAAGNSGSNNDGSPHYPSSYDSENIIAVMSTDHDDLRSSFSCWGSSSVDIAAPGSSILSCKRGGGYISFSGTSMATPHVAGACALLFSQNPFLTVAGCKEALLSTVDVPSPALVCVTGGRLNVARALGEASSAWLSVTPNAATNLAPGTATNITVSFVAGDLAPGTYEGEITISCNDVSNPVQSVPCIMVILADDLRVSPKAGLDVVGSQGGPFVPNSLVYTLTNCGMSDIDWTATNLAAWVDVSPSGGTLDAGGVADVVIAVNTNANGLAIGTYIDTVLFSNVVSGHAQMRPVGLAVKRMYFVNDASTNLDVWCTAPGNDANDGLSPTSPKATVQAVLNAYDLEPGDMVRIDTGDYGLNANIVVASQDQGAAGNPVVFEASPYGVTFDRSSMASGSYGWHISGASYVTLRTAVSAAHPGAAQRWMQVTGGYAGIFVAGTYCRLERVDAAENLYFGIFIDGTCVTVENCLARGSTHTSGGVGIYIDSSYATVKNCTIAGNTKYGVYIGSYSGTTLRNSIICADGMGDYAIYRNSTSYTLNSDYNCFHAANGALVGYSGGDRDTLTDWRLATSKDANSFSRDPGFVDAVDGDYHLESSRGSYHGGVWSTDGADSPGLDTGYGDAGLEPEPNASPLHPSSRGMRNLGAYGGTEQGSLTPPNRRLQLYTPLGGENYLNQAAPVTIRWTWAGTNWQGADTVALEYSANSGGTWNGIAGASAVVATDGQYAWDISGLTPEPFYRVRATCNQDAAVTDASSDDFRIGSLIFYVNNSSTNLDAWCVAPGNDANDGLTPATPKATVQAILDTHKLEPGDTVRIDTGDYLLSENIEVMSKDQGTTDNPVVFEASPYGVTFDRGSTASGSYAWQISGASNVTLRTAVSAVHPGAVQRWMRVTGGYVGIYVAGPHCRLERVEATENLCRGIDIDGTYATVENCLARGSTDISIGAGIFVGSTYATVNNCTMAGNAKYGVFIGSTDTTLRNNIICVDGPGAYAIFAVWQTPSSDYNCFHTANGALVGSSGGDLATLAEWRTATGGDANSLLHDPGFVNAAGGDYHLESTRGSYHGGVWSADDADSPGLDTGYGDAGLEPEPNASPLHASSRGMRNLGAYGGTEQGSLTPSNRRLRLYAPRGGEIYVNQAVPVTIRWTWAGTNWQGADTVALEYSANSGGTWNGIAGASAVVATDGQYPWDISGLTPEPFYRVRATCNQDAAATDASASDFRIGGTLIFYVNDASTNLDAWCTVPGSDANDGLSSATPKATVQAVLDAYDLEPGDTVRIDTGDYGLNDNIVVASQDQGAAGNPVIFEASPYGVTFDRGSTAFGSYGWHISGASYVTLRTAVSAAHPNATQRWMRVTGGYYGIYVAGTYCRLERVDAAENLYRGIFIDAAFATVENCLARGSTHTSDGVGIYVGSSYATVNNCTIAGNTKYGVYISWHSGTTLRNNIIYADGTGDYAIYRNSTSYTLNSDYNCFHAANGALVGYSGGDRATLTDWRTATDGDVNSLSRDPGFVNATGGDYHLESTRGSYHGGVWSADGADSPGLDTGYGDAGLEPEPNASPLH
ncbi:MAG: hypothetical protein EOM20_16375, partial [Spartobacteria bacterium]|nr:hypothetical protein [Spartobacteria bacterium]